MPDIQGRCGKDSHGFYDSKGYYFREGVDPRNYHGRFVNKVYHASDCPAGFSDGPCDCWGLTNA